MSYVDASFGVELEREIGIPGSKVTQAGRITFSEQNIYLGVGSGVRMLYDGRAMESVLFWRGVVPTKPSKVFNNAMYFIEDTKTLEIVKIDKGEVKWDNISDLLTQKSLDLIKEITDKVTQLETDLKNKDTELDTKITELTNKDTELNQKIEDLRNEFTEKETQQNQEIADELAKVREEITKNIETAKTDFLLEVDKKIQALKEELTKNFVTNEALTKELEKYLLKEGLNKVVNVEPSVKTEQELANITDMVAGDMRLVEDKKTFFLFDGVKWVNVGSNLSDVVTKKELEDAIKNVQTGNVDAYSKSETYSKTEIDQKLSGVKPSLNGIVELTEAEFNALSEVEKASGKLYIIS